MITIIIIMISGILAGVVLRKKDIIIKSVNKLINPAIYILLFLLGISVGLNDTIFNNIVNLGINSIIISFGAVTGSIVLAYFTYKYFFQQRS